MKEKTQTWEEKLRKSETVHQERQQFLEKMGISVQSSGIKVETDKFYLVNLNADPSLNELLVYYLKEKTLIGRPDAPAEQVSFNYYYYGITIIMVLLLLILQYGITIIMVILLFN